MIHLPVIRWGKPYESLEVKEVAHFSSGEPIARISQANGGIVQRDLRKADQARAALRKVPCRQLIEQLKRAADLYLQGTLPLGDGQQSPADFVRQQSSSTGLPEHMCRANMDKCAFVMAHMDEILDALTRGLDLDIFTRGYGVESRGVLVSYQAQSPVLGAVLPNNSPGVHTLWIPALALQLGLALKPGSQEPWTAYRIMAACLEAGIPAEAFSLYPGAADCGSALLAACPRSMVFGSAETVAQYRGDPRVQAHGPGFSKILLGDDMADRWEEFLDLMVESIYSNAGRSCINCSGVWASRHTREIAAALAERLGPIDVRPPDDPEAGLAAFTVPQIAQGVWSILEADLREEGIADMTAPYGPRLVQQQRCAYLRPMIVHCDRPDAVIAGKEFMFPFAAIVQCPQDQLLKHIGPTLVGTVITEDKQLIKEMTDAVQIDRLNVGPLPTNRLNWRQPHEGNLIDFLFRSRAYQVAEGALAAARE